MTRRIIRGTLAAAILLFAWYAVSRVHAGAPEAPWLALAAAALLLILGRAAARVWGRS